MVGLGGLAGRRGEGSSTSAWIRAPQVRTTAPLLPRWRRSPHPTTESPPLHGAVWPPPPLFAHHACCPPPTTTVAAPGESRTQQRPMASAVGTRKTHTQRPTRSPPDECTRGARLGVRRGGTHLPPPHTPPAAPRALCLDRAQRLRRRQLAAARARRAVVVAERVVSEPRSPWAIYGDRHFTLTTNTSYSFCRLNEDAESVPQTTDYKGYQRHSLHYGFVTLLRLPHTPAQGTRRPPRPAY